VPARRAQAQLAVLERRHDEAVKIAREIQKSEPKSPLGFTVEADAEASRQNWEAALAATRAAHQVAKSTETAVRLYTVLLQAGKAADAERLGADWLREQPKDVLFRFHLGDMAIARNNLTAAEGHYKAVLEMQPRNAMAMNNLAWLLVKQGRPGAVEMARKANELMPGRAALLDTLALALGADGKLDEAVKVQKEAVARAPADPSMKLGLARLLIKAGDKAYARAELEDLARLGDRFAAQAEVAALLKSL
jgi:cellulose synthase operon protein C